MKVVFHLRRLAVAAPAGAVLLTSAGVDAVLDLCARLGLNPQGRVYAVAPGFLLKLDEPTGAAIPGTIRLRAIARDLFVPVDAELVPALLDDEAEGLARGRGLVFLPGGRVLGFAPDRPLPLASLLTVDRPRRRAWQPLPARRPRADRISAIGLDFARESPEGILEAGGQAIGTEEPRPEDSSLGSKLLGRATIGAGRGMVWMGQAAGLKGLAGLGARWISQALAWAPRLSESVLGRQEAALRELLREFREGDRERALRRALPLGSAGDRGGRVATGHDLPVHDLVYSLGSLLGSGGPAGAWLGGPDVQAELAREYRKAAEQAAQRGDYRRAAFIYGKLLRDDRLAANTLFEGGLHHDAAVLYLTRLGDTLAAARAFAAAGEIDRAVQLYRRRGDHIAAGDLLRRAGDEEAAIVEYRIAADRLVAGSRQGHLAAGELMLTRAGRADLALDYFAAGWRLRPAANAAACALRMAEVYAEQGSRSELLALVAQADEFFTAPGHDLAAGQFYNEVARLAERRTLAEARDELRDRALLGIAAKLRQQAEVETRPGTIVSTMLGQARAWAPAVIRDADFAFKAALQRPRIGVEGRIDPAYLTVRLAGGTVTAACSAPSTGAVFVGFESGAIVGFDPRRGTVVQLSDYHFPVTSLATDGHGDLLVALYEGEKFPSHLASYVRTSSGSYEPMEGRPLDAPGGSWLMPLLGRGHGSIAGLWDGEKLSFLRGGLLVPWGRVAVGAADTELVAGLFLRHPSALVIDERGWCSVHSLHPQGKLLNRAYLGWMPGIPPGSPLRSVPLAWLQTDPEHLALAGLGPGGVLSWSTLQFSRNPLDLVARRVSGREPGYLAVAIIRAGLIAGVTGSRIDWLRSGADQFSLWSTTRRAIPAAITCFPSRLTGELLVVRGDGCIVRVRVPS